MARNGNGDRGSPTSVTRDEMRDELDRELKHYATKAYVTTWLLTLLGGQVVAGIGIIVTIIIRTTN